MDVTPACMKIDLGLEGSEVVGDGGSAERSSEVALVEGDGRWMRAGRDGERITLSYGMNACEKEKGSVKIRVMLMIS